MKLNWIYFFYLIISITLYCTPNLPRDLANAGLITYLLRLSTSVVNSGTNTLNIVGSFTITPTSGLLTNESGLTASFTILLNSAPTADVTIPISSSNTAEGTVSTASLTFTPANYNSPQTVFVNGVDDSVTDGNINYTIVTGAATSADANYSGIDAADISVINLDNDSLGIAGITVSAISGNTSEAATTASFTIVLNSAPTTNVTIPISSSNTAEGTVSVTSITFTPANWNNPQTVTVTGVDDFVVDGNISYSILTGIVTSSDLNYNGLNPSDVTLTNADNDSAGINVSSISGNTSEALATANFTIMLTSSPTANVTIPISSSNTAEGTVSHTSLVFTTANWNTPQTVTATGVNDSVADGDINYTILTGNATSSDSNYSGLNPSDLSLTNIDVGEKRTFLSSTALNGSLGGIAGADSLCNSDGAKPSILPNVYKAMIVDGVIRRASVTANIGDGQIDWVLLPNTAYFRTNGTTQIMTTNANGIFVFGTLTNPFDTAMVPYWSGLSTNWTTSGNLCGGTPWTTTGGNGQAGQASAPTNASIGGATPTCNTALPHLLCVQQ